ncbi:hypothetical protein INT45_011603 [Circinella minor]|uniref:Uncharacterized protein n=1 Tax=Circinella minor TaxID=1195481 RepID=A0A8H7S7B0_9FUNG|nr:hypothetical protein INT45_011603 [Circinella minor]
MYEHNGKEYDYKNGLDLKYDQKDAIAEKHNVKQTSMNFVFDTVQDAGDFSKTVLQKPDKEKVFKAEESFLHPRSADGLPHDFSDKCIIL